MNIRESDMIRKIRLLEWLKAELAVSVGEVMRAVAGGVRVPMADALSRVVVSCYVLGRHLGVGFKELDEAVMRRLDRPLDAMAQEAEDRYGDHRALRRYRRAKE
ncbi:MAG: hypothetical protein IIV84_01355 [Selenomonadales bacterium]|nr:hypothetical protein [Selenomonadales bacterium]MBQ5745604.1 hypothetical protein [Selenomonadales bacterium]MBQ5859844.1 hypothetical protein [Selenomonadales bacterium]MBR0324796.1 hypothetical protein [Selenomonadales bacterium]